MRFPPYSLVALRAPPWHSVLQKMYFPLLFCVSPLFLCFSLRSSVALCVTKEVSSQYTTYPFS